jgi:hypothetical protein
MRAGGSLNFNFRSTFEKGSSSEVPQANSKCHTCDCSSSNSASSTGVKKVFSTVNLRALSLAIPNCSHGMIGPTFNNTIS